MLIQKTCSCGKVTTVDVNKDGYGKYMSGTSIQDAFPELNAFERECVMTGMCFDCQSRLFNKPKPGEDWGPVIGECECCSSPLYSKDCKEGNHYVCPSCGDEGVQYAE